MSIGFIIVVIGQDIQAQEQMVKIANNENGTYPLGMVQNAYKDLIWAGVEPYLSCQTTT